MACSFAVRPNEKQRVNTGRETFILPVDWSGRVTGFLKNGLMPLKVRTKMPAGVKNQAGTNGFLANGNFSFSDDLNATKLDFRWIGVRGARENFSSTSKAGVRIKPYPVTIKATEPTSTLFLRQQHAHFEATVQVQYKPGFGERPGRHRMLPEGDLSLCIWHHQKKGMIIMWCSKERRTESRQWWPMQKIELGTAVQLKVAAQGRCLYVQLFHRRSDLQCPGGHGVEVISFRQMWPAVLRALDRPVCYFGQRCGGALSYAKCSAPPL